MDYFNYQDEQLFAEQCSISEITEHYGSPCYIYSRATLERHWKAFDHAFGNHPHLICYAMKASSNIAILNLLARLGSGFDIVSIGEMERVIAAGGDPKKIVFSGVGKREDEIRAALDAGIHCFNIEVSEEIDRINTLAKERGCIANISIRVNPNVDAKTHPYISTGLKENKFGIDINEAFTHYQHAASLTNIKILGIDCHIGSQLTETGPFLDALDKVLLLVDRLSNQNITVEHLDLGGGLGICYQHETPPDPKDYIDALLKKLAGRNIKILLEPGRAIAGNAGILVTRVEYLKPTEAKNFAIVDAAMNDLLRPALYNAWQAIIPVNARSTAPTKQWDIVGPVCETGDFLGKERSLALSPNDLLAVRSSGAYGFSMSSNYNSRPRPPEILVDGNQAHLIRKRESIASLWQGESLLP